MRKNYLFALLYIPLGFVAIIASFYVIFKSYIDSIDPGWFDGPGLADDGIAYVVVSTLLALLGTVMIVLNARSKSS